MGFKHWEKLDLRICKLFGDCFPLKALWKQPATTGSCPVVLRGGITYDEGRHGMIRLVASLP